MPFLHIERYESIAHCGELLSATRGVLFVLKTPFFAKKIQKGGTCLVYDSPTLRAMHSIHKCVAKDAPHLLAVLRNEPRYS